MSKWNDVYIIALNRPSKVHLAVVTEEMRVLGPPTLRALWTGDHWLAIEGSHRLAAAHKLGLAPIIKEVTSEEVVEHDVPDLNNPAKVSEILETPQWGPDYHFTRVARE